MRQLAISPYCLPGTDCKIDADSPEWFQNHFCEAKMTDDRTRIESIRASLNRWNSEPKLDLDMEFLLAQIDSLRESERILLAKLKKRDEALRELLTAMKRYEMDVDQGAPYDHVAMMERAREALGDE